jgi:exoribonuclease R
VKNLSDKYPELVDILVTPDEDEEHDDKKKRKRFYPEVRISFVVPSTNVATSLTLAGSSSPQYKSDAELAEGLKHGRFHQGVFYINRSNLMEGYVSAEGYDEDILIQGREHTNRAISGDTVVIEVLPKEEWSAPSKLIVQSTTAKSATGALSLL